MKSKIEHAQSLLLEAMVDTNRWLAALEATAEACGARAGQLIAVDAMYAPTSHWISGMPEDFAAQLEAYGFADPRANPRFGAGLRAPLMTAVADQNYADAQTRKRSRIYQDIFEPVDLPFNCQAVLIRDENAFVRASITRSKKQGPLDEDAFRAFESLLPHLQAAVRVQANLALCERNAVLRTLDTLDAAAFLLTDDGRLAGRSNPAAAMIERGDVLRLRAGRLSFNDERDERCASAAIAFVLSSARESPRSAEVVVLSTQGLALEAHPLPRSHLMIGGSPAAIVLIRTANTHERLLMLQRTYQLTNAEAAVAAAIADGFSVNDVAKRRGASIATIRSQLQSIFAKTGFNRQSALVRHLSTQGSGLSATSDDLSE